MGRLRAWRARRPTLLEARSSVPFIATSVALGLLSDSVVDGLISPITPFRLADLGYRDVPAKVSYLVAAFAAGLIISSPPIGILSDYVNSRRTLLVAGMIVLLGSIVMYWQAPSFAVMVVARVLQGFSGTAIWSLGLAMVADNVAADNVGKVMGFVMIANSAGAGIGPVAGGALYATKGYSAPFVFALCLVSVDLVCRLLVIEKKEARRFLERDDVSTELLHEDATSDEKVPSESKGPSRYPAAAPADAKKRSGWRGILFLLRTPRAVSDLSVVVGWGILSGGIFNTSQTMMLQARYSLNSTGAGLAFLGIVVPGVFSSPLMGWLSDRVGSKIPMVISMYLGAAALYATTFRTSLPVFFVFQCLASFFYSGINTPVCADLAKLADTVPGLGSGNSYALLNMAFSIGAFIGPFAAGGFITRFGPERGWVIAVSVCVAVTNATAIPSIFFVGEPVRVPPGVEYSKLDDETTLEGGGPPARPLRQLKLTTKGLPPDYKQRQSAVDRRYARLE